MDASSQLSLVCYRRDFVRITNEKSKMFGVFCGSRPRPGDEVLVTGEYVVIIFHSDYSLQRRGFHISLALIPIGMYRRMLFDK